jgi:protein-L-isoaspartate(D-aspartate) O-methyltransferase
LSLPELRRVYARQMLALADALGNSRLEDAFAAVPREHFLSRSAWRIMTPWSPCATVPTDDPALIYQDVVVALDEERGINNGSPALHAHWLHVAAPRPGERVAHIGAGAGYYTAILAELVGPEGKVTAIEFDFGRAESAARHLEDRSNVSVVAGDGHDWPREAADVVYVNFAAPQPAAAWIDNLRIGGRLILPLGVPRDAPGAAAGLNALPLLIERRHGGLAATALPRVAIVFAEGAGERPNEDAPRLRAALKRGGSEDIRSLVWGARPDAARCWLAADDWGLSFDEPAG